MSCPTALALIVVLEAMSVVAFVVFALVDESMKGWR